MTGADRATFDERMNQAAALEDGPLKVAILQEAVRIADLLADVDLGYQARTALIVAAREGGAPEVALVEFAWCLAQVDRDPARFPESNILWAYQSMVFSMLFFPQIPRARVEEAMADFSRRWKAAGRPGRASLLLKLQMTDLLGDSDRFDAVYAEWKAASRTPSIDLHVTVTSLVWNHRYDEAVELVRPHLGRGGRYLLEATDSTLLFPLLRAGLVEEAAAIHRRDRRRGPSYRDDLGRVGDHIQFLALTDNLARGLKLFERYLPRALEVVNLWDRFWFALHARCLFDRLVASGRETARLRLPETFPGFQESGRYALADLLAWLEADAAGLARRFDERNGNDRYSGLIERSRGWDSVARPFPLRVARTSTTPAPKVDDGSLDDANPSRPDGLLG